MEFGLPESARIIVRAILVTHPKVERAILYGSRAMGTYKTGSDIDLTLTGGDLDYGELANIANDLEESDLPYKVDLSLLAGIANPGLVDHIQRVGKVFYERDQKVGML